VGKCDIYAKSMTKSWHHNGKICNLVFELFFLKDRIRLSSHYHYPVYVIKTKVAFLKGRLFWRVFLEGCFGGPAFIQPIGAIWKVFKKPWLAGKNPALQKSHFCFDHVNRLHI